MTNLYIGFALITAMYMIITIETIYKYGYDIGLGILSLCAILLMLYTIDSL